MVGEIPVADAISGSIRSTLKPIVALACCLSPLAAQAQERTIAMVPSAWGVLQVRVLAQGEQIAVTMEKNGRPEFTAVLAPDEAMHLAAALKEAADSSVARRIAQPRAVTPAAEKTYFEFEVDRSAQLVAGSLAPIYPASLAGGGMSGKADAEVDAMVIVDTTGLAVPRTLKIVHEPNPLFGVAFAQAIGAARFSPAIKSGRKVRQLITLKYTFTAPH